MISSYYKADNYQQLVNIVIYNFKCLFMVAYSRCIRFNIRDFERSYLVVPKQIFKFMTITLLTFLGNPKFLLKCWFIYTYMTLASLLQFMQTYDGTNVQKILNICE